MAAALSHTTVGLGLNAAPSARINRSDSIISPMVSDGNGNYYMSVKALEAATGYTTYPLWSDYVESEMKTPTISDISATISYDANSKTSAFLPLCAMP